MTVSLRQIIEDVYPWLDLRSRGRLHQTAREFRALNIALYVLRNYEVIYSSDKLNHILISPRLIIALGENHTDEAHRYSNSHLIKLLWNNHAFLAVEGSQETLKGWKSSDDNSGMLTYLPEAIKRQTITWDSECVDEGLDDYINFAKEVSQATKSLLKFAKLKKLSYRDFLNFIERHFKEPYKTILETPSLDILKHEEAHLSMGLIRYYKRVIYLEMVKALFSHVDEQIDFYDRSITENNGIRNESFISRVKEIRKDGVRGFFIAGSSHVVECAKLIREPLSDSLFLKPKNRSIDDVHKDLESFFPHLALSSVLRSESDEVIHDYQRSIIEKESVTEGDIEYLKKILKELNPSYIDCDKNHFSVWLHTCLSILEWEAQYPSA